MLEKIIGNKRAEVEHLHRSIGQDPIHPVGQGGGRFRKAIKEKGISVIAEIKRRSPSSGTIGKIEAPEKLALKYLSGKASALSVLTDGYAFGGSSRDLSKVRSHFPESAILRKDFIVDPIQIAESASMGADAVLLIVAILGERVGEYLERCQLFSLDALVEVHDADELKIALEAGARIIGVNNRDLRTFETNIGVSERLAYEIPDGILAVSESGIRCPRDAQKLSACGYDAVLIGEALVRSPDPKRFIAEIKGGLGEYAFY